MSHKIRKFSANLKKEVLSRASIFRSCCRKLLLRSTAIALHGRSFHGNKYRIEKNMVNERVLEMHIKHKMNETRCK